MTAARVPFELDWLGGAAERAFAEHRGEVDALPWGTLDRARFAPEILDQARIAWTAGAHQEWCAAASFSSLLHALLAARAPVDLVGMAGRFVADEMVHVELNARMAAEVGGGAPLLVDPEELAPEVDPRLDALERAITLAVRVSCVGETFSAPILSGTRACATEPLVRAVLGRIVADEGPHGRLGWLALDWALPRLGPAARERLAEAALDAVEALRPLWAPGGPALADEGILHALGWMSPWAYAALADRVVERRILAPLRARGLDVGAPQPVAAL